MLVKHVSDDTDAWYCSGDFSSECCLINFMHVFSLVVFVKLILLYSNCFNRNQERRIRVSYTVIIFNISSESFALEVRFWFEMVGVWNHVTQHLIHFF